MLIHSRSQMHFQKRMPKLKVIMMRTLRLRRSRSPRLIPMRFRWRLAIMTQSQMLKQRRFLMRFRLLIPMRMEINSRMLKRSQKRFRTHSRSRMPKHLGLTMQMTRRMHSLMR